MFTQYKSWRPYISPPFDPCKPIEVKYYATPPTIIYGFSTTWTTTISNRKRSAEGRNAMATVV